MCAMRAVMFSRTIPHGVPPYPPPALFSPLPCHGSVLHEAVLRLLACRHILDRWCAVPYVPRGGPPGHPHYLLFAFPFFCFLRFLFLSVLILFFFVFRFCHSFFLRWFCSARSKLVFFSLVCILLVLDFFRVLFIACSSLGFDLTSSASTLAVLRLILYYLLQLVLLCILVRFIFREQPHWISFELVRDLTSSCLTGTMCFSCDV